MPLYEYVCADCKDRFEILTSYEASQSDTVVCANCHGTRVHKLLSLTARRVRSGGGSDTDFGGDDYGEDMSGGCSCGGACGCDN